jgi:HNH endonuclease
MRRIYIAIAIQRAVIERAKGYCEYCVLPAAFSPNPFNFEHITPLVKDGLTELMNLAYSCGGCNAYKKDKIQALDPLTHQFASLFNPRTDDWDEHFEWSDDDLYMVGKTPTGRATVQLLKVNRAGNVNLRKLLKMAELHPPTFRDDNKNKHI